MNVLITGVNGFIGKNLSTYLLKKGYKVYGFDINKKCNVLGLTSYFSGSVLDLEKIQIAMKNVDIVVHLAAITNHNDIVNNKFKTLDLNLRGTVNTLKAFNNSKTTKKFIFGSTGKVYGCVNNSPIKEEDCTRPLNILGKSKLITEQIIDFYSRNDKSYTIFRMFQVYGPDQRGSFVIPTIFNQLNNDKNKEPEITLGDIKAKRDYVHIDDVINAFLKVIENKDLTKNLNTFNVCTGIPNSVEDIISFIEKIRGVNIRVKLDRKLLRNDEIDVEFGSNCKAKEMLDWRPKISLYEGINKIQNIF